ncbi:ABC transporter ATP-binding protein [Sediminivirga luteola]|uniref:ABC-type quaternary amine transporter n=1 Tax=Sediminivirga luteola TaxID=1774748 RepID=A0A8J2XJT1_9MICO|nr:ABC transporter ATP-binding protein [Sediminivirga luteola]MCI2266209.1 ABC transporter ATP-binding protein [Sediminivirga luteola]GGA08320.1 polyamine-transporting ATPase [Sediminivirga luteola]
MSPEHSGDVTGAALQLRGVTKRFGSFTAIEDISLTIEPGEFVTFLGPSGSGKTTTLNCIAGFEEVTAGEILLGGNSLTSLPIHKRNLGMVFQGYALFPHMTVEKNIAYPLKQRKLPRAAIARDVAFALETVGLTEFKDRMPTQLSGGQRQRVALARAICFGPPLLLMDEPLSALDKALREQLQLEIRRIHRELGTTVVFVTHDQDEALALSDRIVVFDKGRIVQIGTPRELYQNPENVFVSEFVGESVMIAGSYADGEFSTEAGRFSTAAASSSPQWSGPAQMMIRPERIGIAGAEASAPASGDGSGDAVHSVRGVIEDITYVGNAVKYRVGLPGGGGIVRSQDIGGTVGDIGAPVRLSWNPADARILAREDA